MEGLLIQEPWISLILSGRKTWEMRTRACHKRGRIALVRARSGLVVGTADIVDCLPPLTSVEAYAAAERFHAIPPHEQMDAFEGGWRTPWVLTNARPFSAPVPYRHPSGAVIWVALDPAVIRAIESHPNSTVSEVRPPIAPQEQAPPALAEQSTHSAALTPGLQPIELTTRAHVPVPAAPGSEATPTADTRTVRLTGGNVRNGHIYVPLDFFPTDAIGGANKQDAAPRNLRISFNPGQSVETDIDRTKRILRSRTPVRDFIERARLAEGDSVLIEKTAPYAYRFSKA